MKSLLAVVIVLFPHCLAAQQQDLQQQLDPGETARNAVQLLEEITVVGERTFFSIRSQITRAEDNLYSLFNELNNSDEFDITCRKFTYNSHIARRSCEPAFYTKLRRANTVMAFASMRGGGVGSSNFEEAFDPVALQNGIDLLYSSRELQDEAQPSFTALNEEMVRIATENPQYLEALMRVAKLKAVLNEEREKKFSKKSK